jgi:hypothetical protein
VNGRGELIQIDGSDHEWFEERAARCKLLVFVHDATSALVELLFCESESAFSYFTALRSYLEQNGKPVALYSDKAGVFRVNRKEPQGGAGVSQFGRALCSLNIDILCANTPAAKVRVERAHLRLQDRLVKELRLREISDVDAANAFAPEFMEDYNRRFARAHRSEHDAHRPLQPSEDLARVFSWREISPHRENGRAWPAPPPPDGYGNTCDTDLNNDGATGPDDLSATFGAVSAVSTDPKFDYNCDGGAGPDDLSRSLADTIAVAVPGPSGKACAGTPPCP